MRKRNSVDKFITLIIMGYTVILMIKCYIEVVVNEGRIWLRIKRKEIPLH